MYHKKLKNNFNPNNFLKDVRGNYRSLLMRVYYEIVQIVNGPEVQIA